MTTRTPQPGETWTRRQTGERLLILPPLGECVRVRCEDGHETEYSPLAAERLLAPPMNDADQQSDERVMEYLRSKEPGQGFSDRVLADVCGLSLVDAARASHRLHERGLAQRYDTTIDERAFGGGVNCIPCTRIAPPLTDAEVMKEVGRG